MSLADRLNENGVTANGSSFADRLAKSERPDKIAEVRARIQARLVEVLGPQLYEGEHSEAELRDLVHKRLRELIDEEEGSGFSVQEKGQIIRQIGDSIVGFGPLEPFIRDPDVTEIMVNGPETIYVERAGKLYWTGAKFHDDRQLRWTIDKIVTKVGRRIDEASPYVDARLPDGSRVNAIIPPLAVDGPALTVRKFSADPYQSTDLVQFGTINESVAQFLEACVRGRINVLVSGGTGAGKTTTLNVLSSFIPTDERIITIEDSAELKLQQPHVVRLEYRPPNIEGRGEVTIRDLVRNALRMRPDRIVVGEVRGGEALDMLQAMNTGHDGSISTIHANSPRDSLVRLETVTMMAGMELTVRAIREQIAGALEMVIHQARLKDGSRRITHVTEVVGMEGDVITLQDIFLFDYRAGTDQEGRFRGHLQPTGLRPRFLEKLSDKGIHVPPALFMPTLAEVRR
jgi:pilus assembly protein CpaF